MIHVAGFGIPSWLSKKSSYNCSKFLPFTFLLKHAPIIWSMWVWSISLANIKRSSNILSTPAETITDLGILVHTSALILKQLLNHATLACAQVDISWRVRINQNQRASIAHINSCLRFIVVFRFSYLSLLLRLHTSSVAALRCTFQWLRSYHSDTRSIKLSFPIKR